MQISSKFRTAGRTQYNLWYSVRRRLVKQLQEADWGTVSINLRNIYTISL